MVSYHTDVITGAWRRSFSLRSQQLPFSAVSSALSAVAASAFSVAASFLSAACDTTAGGFAGWGVGVALLPVMSSFRQWKKRGIQQIQGERPQTFLRIIAVKESDCQSCGSGSLKHYSSAVYHTIAPSHESTPFTFVASFVDFSFFFSTRFEDGSSILASTAASKSVEIQCSRELQGIAANLRMGALLCELS